VAKAGAVTIEVTKARERHPGGGSERVEPEAGARREERRGRKVDVLNAMEAKFKGRSKLVAKDMEKRWRLSIINSIRRSAVPGVPGKESARTDEKAGEQGTARKMI